MKVLLCICTLSFCSTALVWASPNRTKQRIAKNHARKLAGKEALRPVAPTYTKHEKLLISAGEEGVALVGRLRKHGFRAAAFLEALKLTKLGIALYHQGDYGDSIFIFRRSFRKFPSPSILYWIAKSNMKYQNLVIAHARFSEFLSRAKQWQVTRVKRALIQDAAMQLATLTQTLASCRLTVNIKGAEVAVNGVILREKNRTLKSPLKKKIWLKPGYNQIVVTHKGFVSQQIIIANAQKGQEYKRHVTLLTPKQLVIKSRLFREAQEKQRLVEQRRRAAEEKLLREQLAARKRATARQRIFRVSGYTVMGAGALLLLGGLTFGVLSENIANDLNRAESGTAWETLSGDYERYQQYQSWSRYTLAAGGILIVSGAVLAYFGLRTPAISKKTTRTTTLSLTPLISPRQTGAALSWRF